MTDEVINGALSFTRFTDADIRKTALDLLDIARQLEADGDAQDLPDRMKSIAVLLVSYFPQPEHPLTGGELPQSSPHSSLKEHTSNGC